MEGCREVEVWRGVGKWGYMEVAARGLRPRDSVPQLWGRRHKLKGVKRAGMPGCSSSSIDWGGNGRSVDFGCPPQGPMC